MMKLFVTVLQTGFIKAFSDHAHSFTTGFAHVERTMKNLFVKKLFLWPRFHASIVACLEQHKVTVSVAAISCQRCGLYRAAQGRNW